MDERLEVVFAEKMKENNAQLLKEMGTLISQISAKNANNSSQNEIPNLKRKSNEEQFKHNQKTLSKIEEVENHLNSGNIEQAKESLIEGK